MRPLLPPAPCGLIVTSRRSIALSGMRSFNLDLLSEDEARALLGEILGQERATQEELDEIARLCGRLPLALRVAGSFLKVHADWTPAEYARRWPASGSGWRGWCTRTWTCGRRSS